MIQELITGTISYSTPLILAALGGYFSERSGTVNIALEGKMLLGAFFSVAGAYWSGSILVGILCSLVAGGLFGFLHGYITILLKCDDILSGIAINILALGITGYGLHYFFGRSGSSPTTDTIKPLTGDIPLLFLPAVALVIITHLWQKYTVSGLRHRAVGESIEALVNVGVAPGKIKMKGTILAGLFAGLGGAQLSLGELGSFVEMMTAGRGFIALAVLILAKWKPIPIIFSALFFGFTKAGSESLELVASGIPSDIILLTPFLVTLIVLAVFTKDIQIPRALGKKTG